VLGASAQQIHTITFPTIVSAVLSYQKRIQSKKVLSHVQCLAVVSPSISLFGHLFVPLSIYSSWSGMICIWHRQKK
jgi:hypothetical protein